MTVLEIRQRRKNRAHSKRHHHYNFPSARVRKLFSKRKERFAAKKQQERERSLQMQRVFAGELSALEQESPLEVDRFTLQAMQIEVQNLLSDKSLSGSTCTALDVISALKSSRVVSDACRKPRRGAWGSIVSLFSGHNHGAEEYTQRMYRLMAIFAHLEQQPTASTTVVSTWEEARRELEAGFSFASAEENDDGEEMMQAAEDPLLEKFQKRMDAVRDEESNQLLEDAQRRWAKVVATQTQPPIHPMERDGAEEQLDAADQIRKQRLDDEWQERDERLKGKAAREAEERMAAEERAMEEAAERAADLMHPLTDEETEQVEDAIFGIGPASEVMATAGADTVVRGSMQRLRPGQWLNDEVIHFFLAMLTRRDEEMCREDPTRKRCHFFKSFFITKLMNIGHDNPDIDGTYQYSNVKRWSKKVPGKDIFNLDKIIFPINVGMMHWVCAVAFMQEKRIQFYDSMGDDGLPYLESILEYIKDEHKAKKGSPLPDEDEWELVTCTRDTPRQLNGYDCGVFTCMFADFLSKDCPLVFNQNHITQCRHRIALSILRGTAIM